VSYEQFTITITIAHNSQPVAHSKKSHPLKQTSTLYVIRQKSSTAKSQWLKIYGGLDYNHDSLLRAE
jgi:hypothetical protein